MKRRKFISMAVALALVGAPAFASSTQDEVIRRLADEGYTQVRVTRTLLGRVRIVATSPTHRREIVLNGRTGEILRDYWVLLNEAEEPTGADEGDPGKSGPSEEQEYEDDEDEYHDDDEYDDSYEDDESDDESDDRGGDDEDDSDGDDEDDF